MGNFTGFGQLVSNLKVKPRLIFVLTYVLGLMYHIVHLGDGSAWCEILI